MCPSSLPHFKFRLWHYPIGLLLSAVFCFFGTQLIAQKPVNKKPAAPSTKSGQPKLNAFLGTFSGTAGVCDVEQGRQLVRMLIRVEDDKKNTYKVISYQFGYTRIGIVEDEKTGKISPQSDVVSRNFTATPLPDLWVNNITETLRRGEQLHFFDIICSDKQGRLFFAPEIKVDIR